MTGHNFKCPPGQVSNVNGSIWDGNGGTGTIRNGGMMETGQNTFPLGRQLLSLAQFMFFEVWSLEQHHQCLGNLVEADTQGPPYATESAFWWQRSELCL